MKVVVIVVNFRTAELLIESLASLAPEMAALPDGRVVVVDNASGDRSFERISEEVAARGWQRWVSVFDARHNGGFASGNNFGLERAREKWSAPEYVHLLNPDTVVRPGALAALLDFMDQHPDVGIAGSRLEDPDGTPQRSAFRFPSVWGELEASARLGLLTQLLASSVVAPPCPDDAAEVDWVAGASMLIRRAVLDDIGFLDERYFMYFEEVDFTARARRAGWSCWYVPASRVVHLVGRASGVTDPRRARRRRPDYWFDSRRRYILSHLGRRRAAFADLAFAVGHLSWRVHTAVRGKSGDAPEHLLWDLARHSVVARSFRA